MRLLIMLFMLCAAEALCQPSSTPQSQPLPPVIRVEMPSQSFWRRSLELAVPAALAAGLALFGVWLTNQNNASTNAEKRKHELARLDRQHSFELKRDLLIRLTQLLVQTVDALAAWNNSRGCRDYIENGRDEPATEGELKEADADITESWSVFRARQSELSQAVASSCLAISDDLWKSAQALEHAIEDAQAHISWDTFGGRTIGEVRGKIKEFTQDARKELGIV